MIPNQTYTICKKIKIHTKPLATVVVSQTGLFVKETDKYLCFRGFKVRKDCVVQISKETN
jgi:hypothetical protein